MKKVTIVGLGRLGTPLAMSLAVRGWQVTDDETTSDGVEAARMNGVEGYSLRLEPELVCEADDLDALMDADALVIMLSVCRSGPEEASYLQATQELVDSALAYRIPRIIFTSSTSVYGDVQDTVKEGTLRNPITASGCVLKEFEDWLYNLLGTSVDILRLIGSIGPGGYPGRFPVGKMAPDRHHSVNLVHLGDVVPAITLLLQAPKGGHIYNICAPMHSARNVFYLQMARQLGTEPPEFRGGMDNGKSKVIDGNRICNEFGFEYQYPDPPVMPTE